MLTKRIIELDRRFTGCLTINKLLSILQQLLKEKKYNDANFAQAEQMREVTKNNDNIDRALAQQNYDTAYKNAEAYSTDRFVVLDAIIYQEILRKYNGAYLKKLRGGKLTRDDNSLLSLDRQINVSMKSAVNNPERFLIEFRNITHYIGNIRISLNNITEGLGRAGR